MKIVLTVFLVFFFSLPISLNAQNLYWWWPNHQLIPSQENSTNVFISGGVLAWEHEVDTATTAIYYQITGITEPICLLCTPGVKYTKPFIHGGYPNNLVFFEANINGNTDIYLIPVDGSWNPITEMQPLTTSLANDHGFQYIENSWPRKFAWLEDETLKVADLVQNDYHFTVSNIITVDSSGCSSPVVFEFYNSLYWIKNMGFYDVVKYSISLGAGWSEPVNIDTAVQIEALRNTTYNYQHLQWTFKEDTNWFMMDCFPDNSSFSFVIPDVSQDIPFDFDVCDIGYGVKSSGAMDGNFFQAYIKKHNGFNEVFLNLDYDINTYYNFSNMGADCRNPQFFIGEYASPNTFMFYLTWESFVNNSWQTFYSKTPITWGGIEEQEIGLIKNLVVSPNPFIDKFTISFDIEKPVSLVIDLVDIHGRLLENLCSEKCDGGSFSKQFDLSGNGFTGPCLIRFNFDGSYSFVKVIRVR
jgi:hypothetical protein